MKHERASRRASIVVFFKHASLEEVRALDAARERIVAVRTGDAPPLESTVYAAWARLVVAAADDASSLATCADDPSETNVAEHAEKNAAYWAAVQALRDLKVDVDELLRVANKRERPC